MARRPGKSNITPLRPRRRSRASRKLKLPLAVFSGSALLGGVIGIAPLLFARTAVPVYDQQIAGCRAIDGDTLNCGGERVRLLAIDAPELEGHCRPGRVCVSGDPQASTSSLSDATTGQLTIDRVGEDHYGRTLARIAGSNGDLSCWQLRQNHAVYKANWDNGLRIARTCPGDIW